MLYFFHHYELPLILHQAQLQHLLLRSQSVPASNPPEDGHPQPPVPSPQPSLTSTSTQVTSTTTVVHVTIETSVTPSSSTSPPSVSVEEGSQELPIHRPSSDTPPDPPDITSDPSFSQETNS